MSVENDLLITCRCVWYHSVKYVYNLAASGKSVNLLTPRAMARSYLGVISVVERESVKLCEALAGFTPVWVHLQGTSHIALLYP